MTTTILQKNFYNFKNREKSPTIEMNEPPSDVIAKDVIGRQPEVVQTQGLFYIQSQIQRTSPLQGSALSLGSRSLVDQSDVQPLTDVHTCRYDECNKFHHTNSERGSVENPMSPLKNFSLYLVIILLILWIIVYTILTKLKVL